MTDLDYTVGLDPNQFERGERRVTQSSARMRGRLQTDFGANSRSVAAFARNARAAAAGATAVLAGIGAAVKSTMDQVGALASQAQTAGVSFEAFQELKFAADQNLVSVDALSDGLKEMQLRIDEALVSGGGPAVESLDRLGFSVEEITRKLQDPAALFEEIIDRVKDLDQAAQIRVLDELFGGTAGEQFLRLLDDAKGAIADNREEARQLGIVISDDMRMAVEEVNREWNRMTAIVGTNIKSAVLDLLGVAMQVRDVLNTPLPRVAAPDVGAGETLAELRMLQAERSELVAEIERVSAGVASGAAFGLQDRLRALDGQIDSTKALLDDLAQRRDADAQFDPRGRQQIPALKRNFVVPTEDDETERGTSRSGGGRSSAASEADRQAEAIQNVIESLRFEQDQLGRTEVMQRVYNELKVAGVDINSVAGQEIQSLVQQIENETEALERGAEAARYMGDAVEGAIMDMVPDIETGNAALDRLVNTLIEASAQAALFNKGPLAGLFSGGVPGLGGGGGRGLLGGLLIPGILHAGGTAGRDGYAHNRVAPMAAFTHARRFHQGSAGPIGPGEVPAILKQGEEVGWPHDLARKYGGRVQRLDVAVTGYLVEKDGQIVAMIDHKSQSAAAAVASAVPAMVDGRLNQRETRRIRPQTGLV